MAIFPPPGGAVPGPLGGGGVPPESPGGGMGGGPEGMLQILAGMQKSPPPSGEEEALRDASMKIGMAASRVALRSAKAARLLAEAIAKIQSAREALQHETSRPMAPPPDFGLAGAGGSPSPMGAGPY